MTTILGIKVATEYGEGVVLGSDSQLNVADDNDIHEEKRKSCKKIVFGKNWALAHCGGVDDALNRFYGVLEGKKRYHSNDEIAERIISESVSRWGKSVKGEREKKESPSYEDIFRMSHFELVNILNTSTRGSHKIDDEQEDIPCHDFLLATCPPKLGLWLVDSYGILREASVFERELNYLCLGSGAEKAANYIKGLLDDDNFDLEKITIPMTIDIVSTALHRAERDFFTGGPLDLVVLTSSGVDYYGGDIRREIENAEKRKIEEIKKKYVVTSS